MRSRSEEASTPVADPVGWQVGRIPGSIGQAKDNTTQDAAAPLAMRFCFRAIDVREPLVFFPRPAIILVIRVGEHEGFFS